MKFTIEIFENTKQNSEVIEGIIRDKDGNINMIKDTHWVTIPEIFKVREELFPSVINIKQFNHNNSIYYFAGVVRNGMSYNISTAVNICKIDLYSNSQELFSKLLPLMNVGFVHNKQLTVVPFPFKYLREYVKKLGF
ncbi:MAG: hypothetical protein K2G88_05790 [Oscillospiraceae bacterium]|nr:hypothetical protein [Oscillospiraceae bacterium]